MKYLNFLILSILFISCSENKPATTKTQKSNKKKTEPIAAYKAIDKPFENLDNEFQSFSYNPKRANEYKLASGTKIRIPKNAFIDAGGNPIDKKVELKYREFHTPTEIILSGINMNYQNGSFESAGMFEIRAFDQENELLLGQNKVIEVDLASYKEESDYQNFYLDESSGWQATNDEEIIPNKEKKQDLHNMNRRIDEMERECKYEATEYQANDPLVDLNLSHHLYRELGMFSDAMWKVEQLPPNTKQLFSEHKWTNIELKEIDCEVFEIKVDDWTYSKKDKTELTFRAIPVWKGKAYQKKKKGFHKKKLEFMKNYNKMLADRRQKDREADILRTFYVSNMGIWNSDRIIKEEGYLAFNPIMNFGKEFKTDIAVFLIVNNSMVIKHYAPYNQFSVNPKNSNQLVSILPGDVIAKISANDFQKLLAKYKFDIEGKEIQFDFISEDVPCKSKDQVEEALALR